MSAASALIASRLSRITTPYGTTTLSLPRGDTITYPSNCPSIRMIVRRIKELNYLVEVHLFPKNNVQSFLVWYGCVLVTIKDTLLYTVPFPPIPILQSAPGLTKIEVDRALRQAILRISTGVTLRSSAPP
jgi:hypothetical protein